MFSKNVTHSPVSQDFIWVAEYVDGTYLSEFDFFTKKENNFYSIKKNETIRYGLIGHGCKLYYETIGGIFKLNGQMIEIAYEIDGKEYNLTGNQKYYNDIISYKDAESVLTLNSNIGTKNNINQYNFGYKVNLHFNEVNFSFKAICKIPFDKPMYLNFRLVSDKDLDGFLIIKKNGFVMDRFHAPLEKNVGGELNLNL